MYKFPSFLKKKHPRKTFCNTLWFKVTAILVFIFLQAGISVAQNVLPRISVATRADGLGHVFRLHFESMPDSFKVFQPSPDLIQVAIFKKGINISSTSTPPPGQTVKSYNLTSFGSGFGLDIHLNENQYFLARAYPDANGRHLLLGLTQVGAREIRVLTEDLSPIDWRKLSPDYRPAEPEKDDIITDSLYIPTLPDVADSIITPPIVVDTPTTPTPLFPSNNEDFRLRTLVIDAGHGGRDPGAVGPNRTREKDITLAVALKLGEYVNEHLPDVNVVYTRKDDTFIELQERGRIANRARGDLFVSIHTNSSTNRQPFGTEVYFLGVARTQEALEVMKRENSVISLEDPRTRTRELTNEELILYELTNIGYMSTSQRLAEKLDRQFADRAGRRSRGVKQAGFLVLYHASMPAILVELGFISNVQEERYMASEQGQAILASAIFRAIRDYKESLERR